MTIFSAVHSNTFLITFSYSDKNLFAQSYSINFSNLILIIILLDRYEEPHYCKYNRPFQDYTYTCDLYLQEYKCQAEKRKIYQLSARR